MDPSAKWRMFLQMDPSAKRSMFLQVDPSGSWRTFLQMDPVTETHQRDVPVLCIPRIPHRKITPSLTIIRVKL
ncbi:hypothetical protein AB205_0120700 [Aquarana catesbeiana]|uniref:Uncharacterized protein n=1 Tax=Aquarana catesbeiana TaxID=8400 RepID=A0A2G9RIS6_AQUCT|nr:hypothetical protein AB205_0120700 [Aquarana catesbeiana]